ncbi:MAG: helix-turn-helix domain-containing protein [Clostridia bacterium]|jgi:transcriptional regulator with XRE-family HTH domain|nr:helix-turn-helix domain-containing protein [Clostridia bacterium]
MEFKDRLRRLRKENKMTQGELAKKLNYGYTAVSNYESGRNEPGIRELIILSDIFGVSVDYLIGKTDKRKDDKN